MIQRFILHTTACMSNIILKRTRYTHMQYCIACSHTIEELIKKVYLFHKKPNDKTGEAKSIGLYFFGRQDTAIVQCLETKRANNIMTTTHQTPKGL